jgi:hypothetical protein
MSQNSCAVREWLVPNTDLKGEWNGHHDPEFIPLTFDLWGNLKAKV